MGTVYPLIFIALTIHGGYGEQTSYIPHNKQGGSVWIERDGGSSAVTIPLQDVFIRNKAKL